MPAPVRKPYVGTAPILDEVPLDTDWGQLVRVIGPISIVLPGGAPLLTHEQQPTTGTVSRIPVAIASVVLAAANANRRGLRVYNNSAKILYVREMAGACTLLNWTSKLQKDDWVELPFPSYTGEVTGFWSAADPAGSAQVTEWTV